MRVTITHGEKSSGVFSKSRKHTVTVDVVLTDFEKTVIQQQGFELYILYKRKASDSFSIYPDEDKADYKVRAKDIEHFEWAALSVVDAKDFQDGVIKALKGFSEMLSECQEIDPKVFTFEL